MLSKSLAIGALAAGCVAAAAGGAYLSVRQNVVNEPLAAASTPAPDSTAAVKPADALTAVAETEAVVSSPAATPTPEAETSAKPATDRREPVKAVTPEKTVRPTARTQRSTTERAPAAPTTSRPQTSSRPESTVAATKETREPITEPPAAASAPSTTVPVRPDVEPVAPVEVAPPPPQLEHLVVPASSVMGLRVETALTTERAQVEDRVEARVTRDVMVDGRVAIPSGARALGSVTLVERGGKMKDRARLGVRFHTLALADGRELPINTEAIYREGDSPSGESARKIGGAAVGGAILGALIGGKKGAVVGGATGAAGGTAVVMAGDRNAATLPTGTIVTIRLAAPVGVEVEKR
jgi:hypothetical protein